jgi:ferredoxin
MNLILCCSPTGNGRYLAAKLQKALSPEPAVIRPMEFADPSALPSETTLWLIYPIHAFNPPRTVKRFVKSLPAVTGTPVGLIATGCTDAWINYANSRGLRKLLQKKGYVINAEVIVPMPLTLVMKFSDDLAQRLVDEAPGRLGAMVESYRRGEITSLQPSIAAHVIHSLGKIEDLAARIFGLELHAKNSCTSCGLCATQCPEGNIRMGQDGRPRFGFRCMLCLRCVYQCPAGAIRPRFSKFIPIRGGYQAPQNIDSNIKISSKEIV